MRLAERLLVAREVAEALASGAPVVALESTLISHGLPFPANAEVAMASEAAVREHGAVPATIAIHGGSLLVGLGRDELLALAMAAEVVKAARPNLAAAMAGGGWAATTVSATMIGAYAAGIRAFATGGIGGVHRGAIGGAGPTFDISADLEELARTPLVVVCAGPKAILDVAATIEYLETRGVPVVVLGQTEVPGFYARRSGVRAPIVAGGLAEAADLAGTHLGLGLGSAILICAPVPLADALDQDVMERAIETAIRDAERAGIDGPAVTPWLLSRVAELTDGASVRANTALIVHNAATAADLAVRLAEGQERRERRD